ncbi:O-antigen ligase family protein [Mycolicibacterium murale]|uniref:O-antigen ligase family protein n=1 Tax=Mycolicibacterium murale TaxID=182220 RepID=UPI001876D953|nr:O-antigen ligase family protein [Mycolicibacterium murale]MCV7185731.1 O-antigen ligase family protein [Mycolicibacterium murale]
MTAPLAAERALNSRRRTSILLVTVSVVLIWVKGWAQGFVLTLQFGQFVREDLTTDPRASELASLVSDLTLIAPIVALLLAFVLSIKDLPSAQLGFAAALISPWIILYPGFLFFEGLEFSARELVYPIFVLAVCVVRPTVDELVSVVAKIGVVTAICAVLLGVFLPSIAYMPASWNADKQILGEAILMGMYAHSNQLGTVLALSIPFIVGAYSGVKRNLYLVVVVVASVWSASRSSLLAIAAFCLVGLIIAVFNAGKSRALNAQLYAGAVVVACGVAVWLPISTENLDAYTSRGLIWQMSLEYWSKAFWLGWGPEILSTDNELTWMIGARPKTSHNIWLTFATTGGVLAVVAFLIAFGLLTVFAMKAYRLGWSTPMLFALMLALIGIAEDPVRVLHLGPQSFIVWSGFALALCEARQIATTTLANSTSSPRLGLPQLP